jgi:hypothetical protein
VLDKAHQNIRLRINKKDTTKKLDISSMQLNGHISFGPVHGCISNIELNGKEPMISDDHQGKGDQYSINGCPKL